MSVADGAARQEYGTIVVVGGGCYGGYYVRQLHRAAQADAIAAREVVVVDRDAECQVARELASNAAAAVPTRVVVSEWRDYFTDYLGAAASAPESYSSDAVVPSPLMPHLMGEWLVGRARARWPNREMATQPFDRAPAVPWERAGADGTHYVSFATWMCPINCVEPRTCPHTRDARSWSMPERLAAHSREEAETGQRIVVATLFCRHRAYGVGMFGTDEVLAADDRIRTAGDAGSAEVMIGTVSHCHGALTRLVIGAPAALADSHVG
jgi:hypothetical protein